jgi:protoporphyrinogen oxidase
MGDSAGMTPPRDRTPARWRRWQRPALRRHRRRPRGLTAGYLLAKAGRRVIVLEAEDQVGGLAKTVVDPDGYRFDLAGTASSPRARRSTTSGSRSWATSSSCARGCRASTGAGKFLDYPLRGADVVKKLGPIELPLCLLSYLWAAIKPKGREDNVEQWVSNRFGKRLYNHFFKSYTEKVWGVPTTELRAEWAAQRIKGLSFFSAAKAAFFGNRGNKIKSLIGQFQYPRYGPGQMWEQMTTRIEELGGEVRLNTPATQLEVASDGEVIAVHTPDEVIEPKAVISSLPLRATVGIADPKAPEPIVDAAQGLRYRDFLTVALVLDGDDVFPDNWIYIHEPGVRVGRIQNYRSWSPWMVPDPDTACVGLEYFCFEGDDLWTMSDDDLVALATTELEQLNLAPAGKVRRGHVVRVPQAYPMYDEDYSERVDVIKGWLGRLTNLQQVGPQRAAPLQQLRPLDAQRAAGGRQRPHARRHDIWAVNVESSYHEEETDAQAQQPYRRCRSLPR